MLASASPVRQLALSLLALPPLFLAVYILTGFPYPPSPPDIHPSLASLPPTCASWSIYPEDYYQGGAYALLPHGKVSLRLRPQRPSSSRPHTDPILAYRTQARSSGERSCIRLYTLFSQLYHTGSSHSRPLHPSHCLEGRGTSSRLTRLSRPPLR